MSDIETETEKKSERIEIRLGHTEKQGFLQACDTQGDTPSEALRRFIDGYARRADSDLRASALREMRHSGILSGWRFPAIISGAVLALFLVFVGSMPSQSYIVGSEAYVAANSKAVVIVPDSLDVSNVAETPDSNEILGIRGDTVEVQSRTETLTETDLGSKPDIEENRVDSKNPE